MKTCFVCEKTLPLTEFYKHPTMADGRLGKCGKCTREYMRLYRLENIKRFKARDRARNKLPHRIEKSRQYVQTVNGRNSKRKANNKWKENNPEKRQANAIVGNAVRDGRLIKTSCVECDSTVSAHGHHEDYNKPLVVIWLCPKCHSKRHKEKTCQSRL